jgi:hypothetical protein
MSTSDNLNKRLDVPILDQPGHKLIRGAAVPNYQHILTCKIEGVIPSSAMKDFSSKVLNTENILGTFGHIRKAHSRDQKAALLGISIPSVAIVE